MKRFFRWVEAMGRNAMYFVSDNLAELIFSIFVGACVGALILVLFTPSHPDFEGVVVVTAIRSDSTYDMGSVVATFEGKTVMVLDIPPEYMPYMQVGDSLHYNSSYPNPQFVEFRGCITEFSISPDGERVP